MRKTATGICIALALATGFFLAGFGVGRVGAGATTAFLKQEEPYGNQGQPPMAGSEQPAGREIASDQAFNRQLAEYVEKTRPVLLDDGEISLGYVPSKANEKYALPAVIALNHYLADKQYQSWAQWPQHPADPVLVNYEILTPQRGGMDIPWVYTLSARLYWAVFKQNPMLATELSYEERGQIGQELFPDPAPERTWYENAAFMVAPEPRQASAAGTVQQDGKTWLKKEYGGQGWQVTRLKNEVPPVRNLSTVATKGLPMLFDIPFPPQYRGEESGGTGKQ